MNKGFCVADLGWGDSGKGRLTQDLTLLHGSSLVVRYSGGPQSAHNVFSPAGVHHCFSQFGAGSLLPNVRTHIGPYALVEPYAMLLEARDLSGKGCGDVFDRLSIDPRTVLITPWHQRLNQIREISRGGARHGSCGKGIGETRSMEIGGIALRVGQLRMHEAINTLRWIRQLCIRRAIDLAQSMRYGSYPDKPAIERVEAIIMDMSTTEQPAELLRFYRDWLSFVRVTEQPPLDDKPVIFEGSQGVLLDERYGTTPYNSWTDTTFDKAIRTCAEWGLEPIRVGVIRSYTTRHGAGPFPTEDSRYRFPDHNATGEWQGAFRQGPLDLMALDHAVRVSKPDCLAVTHMDRLESRSASGAGRAGGTAISISTARFILSISPTVIHCTVIRL